MYVTKSQVCPTHLLIATAAKADAPAHLCTWLEACTSVGTEDDYPWSDAVRAEEQCPKRLGSETWLPRQHEADDRDHTHCEDIEPLPTAETVQLDDFIDFAVTTDPRSRQLQFRPVNIQAALIKGFEAELAWAFYEGFEFFANYTDITGDNKTDGEPLVTIPPRKGVLGLSDTYAPWWLTVGGRMQIVDDQNRVPEGVPRTGGHTVYDVFANWQPQHGLLKGLRVDVGIDNLTDKEYRRHVSGIPEAGINPKLTLSYSRSW